MDQSDRLGEPYKESGKQYLHYFKEKFNDKGQALLPVIRQIPLPICVTNSKGIFEQVNDAYCAFYQYSRDELIGQHFTKVVPEAYKARLSELHEAFMANKYELADEWEVQRRDGSIVPIFANAAYVMQNGEPMKVTFVLDISDTKKAEAELKETVRRLNALVVTQESAMELLLHDLRGPVSNILSLAEFLSDESFTPAQRGEFTKRLQQSAQRAFNLTNRLYGIVQIENGKYVPVITSFDLYQLIHEIWEDLSILVNAKKLTLVLQKIEKDKPSLTLNSDNFLINIVFYNLIKNAVEASPKGKEVKIALEEKDFLKVEIHNEGVIPPEVQLNFFQKYITSGKARGSGLGAYIAKKTASILGSEISFTSSTEKGTTLYLQFPIDMISR